MDFYWFRRSSSDADYTVIEYLHVHVRAVTGVIVIRVLVKMLVQIVMIFRLWED